MARPRKPSPTPPLSRQPAIQPVLPTDKAVSAEHAALAGTLQSGTSLTPGIEGDEDDLPYNYGLCFLLKYTEDGPQLDVVIDVSTVLGLEWMGMLAAEKLTGKKNATARGIASSFQMMMMMRARMDGAVYGPYLIKFQEETAPETLEKYLRALDPETRKAFLNRSKI